MYNAFGHRIIIGDVRSCCIYAFITYFRLLLSRLHWHRLPKIYSFLNMQRIDFTSKGRARYVSKAKFRTTAKKAAAFALHIKSSLPTPVFFSKVVFHLWTE